MTRRLTSIARDINDCLPGFTATVERSERSTGAKVGRLRWTDGTTTGNVLIVVDRQGREVYRLDKTNPYNRNQYAEDWLERRRTCPGA